MHPTPLLNPSTNDFGFRLRQLRTARGLSQSQFAIALGVSVAAVCGWEKGRMQPRADRMIVLAKLLGVSPETLLGLEMRELLHEQIAQSRERIATLAGTSPDKVRIVIEV